MQTVVSAALFVVEIPDVAAVNSLSMYLLSVFPSFEVSTSLPRKRSVGHDSKFTFNTY